jgi:hypothetical protein
MIAQTCPTPERWRAHLQGTLPAEEESELAAHLDGCPACQRVLETLTCDADSLLNVARAVGAEPQTQETALKEAMGALRDETAGTQTASAPTARWAPGETPADLAFLDPPARPGHLGRLGRYEVLEVVGRGGMGVVLKALDEKLNRIVAIKVLGAHYAASEHARKRFEREARAAAAVSHDHIVPIYHVDEYRGVVYLVMPLIAGKSLHDRLAESGPLELKEILRIGAQIACGLAAAHKQNLVHRDIKPANILLEDGGVVSGGVLSGGADDHSQLTTHHSPPRVKITDFGLARAVDDASLSQSGVVAGTPLYMSPEQARGETNIDARSDLFSLGSVLYAMATGKPPFQASGSMAVLKRVCDEAPPPLCEVNPDMPKWLEATVAKLHAKKPQDRFQSAQEVADLLNQHLAHLQEPQHIPLPPPVRPPAPPAPASTRRSSGPMFVLVVVCVVALGGCVVAGPVLFLVLGAGFWIMTDQVGPMRDVEGPMQAMDVAMLQANKAPDPAPAEWLPLFKDKNLNGWKGLPAFWKVEDGELIGSSLPRGIDFNTFLCSERDYKDFELKFKVRVRGAKPNSGVQIRSTVTDPGRMTVVGPQCGIGETHWGDLFQEGPGARTLRAAKPGALDGIRPDDFNDYHIRCVGQHITITVNGFVTVDDDVLELPATGVIAWQIHRGEMEVIFRDVWLKDLSPPAMLHMVP